jgi:hypothetical protein
VIEFVPTGSVDRVVLSTPPAFSVSVPIEMSPLENVKVPLVTGRPPEAT